MTGLVLQRRTVAEELAGNLSIRILRGGLRPGTPLREEAVADEYGTTRTTVRDALRLLERDGLVMRETHRGARVALVDQADLDDIAAMRLVVEPQVVRRAAESGVDVTPLNARVDELEAAAHAGDWAGYGEADLHFHAGLVRLCGSGRLLRFFEVTLRRLKLAMLAADAGAEATPEPPVHVHEHRRMLELIAAGNADAAADLMTRHIEASRLHLVEGVGRSAAQRLGRVPSRGRPRG